MTAGTWTWCRSALGGLGPYGAAAASKTTSRGAAILTSISSATQAELSEFVNIQRKFFRVMGLAKMTVLLASTIVGYNVDRIRSFLARKAEEVQQAAGRQTRAKRRRGTWSDMVDVGSDAPGPDPPG